MHAEQSAAAQTIKQQLLKQLIGVLNDLDPIQTRLLDLYRAKSKALKQVDVERVEKCGAIEEELTRELQFVLLARQQLLQTAEQHGLPFGTLKELLSGLKLPDTASVFQRIEEAEQRSKKLRHESWVQWIVSQRSYQHYSQILELIANAGKKIPTYSSGQNESHSGGAIFDASA